MEHQKRITRARVVYPTDIRLSAKWFWLRSITLLTLPNIDRIECDIMPKRLKRLFTVIYRTNLHYVI